MAKRISGVGNVNQTMNQGNIAYVFDDTDMRPLSGHTDGKIQLPQREYFIFYPGKSALSSTSTITGMVLSGVRQGSAGTITAGSAITAWHSAIDYTPLRAGKIDGKATGGTISGQLTVGLIGGAASTCAVKVTAGIGNTGAGSTTCLFLSATTIAVGGTTEVYKTYDINHLLTDANFNAIPFTLKVGAQSDFAAASCAASIRVMENSYIEGYFEPGT